MHIEPLPIKSSLIPVLSGVLITALVAGGGAYVYQKSQNDKTRDDLQSQITTLRSQLATLPTTTHSTSATAQPSSTPDLTANWQSYTNSTYNYTIKFPKDWQILKTKDNDSTLVFQKIISSTVGDESSYAIEIFATPYSGTAIEYIANQRKQIADIAEQGGPAIPLKQETPITINSYGGYRITDQAVGPNACVSDLNYLKNGTNIFRLEVLKKTCQGTPYDMNKFIITGNQILTTFQINSNK